MDLNKYNNWWLPLSVADWWYDDVGLLEFIEYRENDNDCDLLKWKNGMNFIKKVCSEKSLHCEWLY